MKVKFTLPYADYENAKEDFEALRKLHKMQYRGGRTGKDYYLHSWGNDSDSIEAYYLKDGEKVHNVEIIHTFETLSPFGIGLHEYFGSITDLEFPDGKPIDEAQDRKAGLVRAFLWQIGIDPNTGEPFKKVEFSDEFIKNTIIAIEDGVLTYTPRRCGL